MDDRRFLRPRREKMDALRKAIVKRGKTGKGAHALVHHRCPCGFTAMGNGFYNHANYCSAWNPKGGDK